MNGHNWVKSITILCAYLHDGMHQNSLFDAEHDIIVSCVESTMLSENSDDGKKLDALGWFIDEYGFWAHYT